MCVIILMSVSNANIFFICRFFDAIEYNNRARVLKLTYTYEMRHARSFADDDFFK